MPLAEIKDFNVLIHIKPFFDQPVKKNKKYEKSLKYQELMTIQPETYLIVYTIKIMINLLLLIYQDK